MSALGTRTAAHLPASLRGRAGGNNEHLGEVAEKHLGQLARARSCR